MTKYIKPGMTDREAIAAIVTDIINRNKTTRRYDWLTVVKDTERTSTTATSSTIAATLLPTNRRLESCKTQTTAASLSLTPSRYTASAVK